MSAEARRRTVQAALVLAATFVLGAISGAGFLHWSHGPPPGPPPHGGPIPVDELDLTPAQHERVRAILDAHRPEVEAVLDESRPRLEQINDRVVAQVREVLTEEQRERLDELRARRGPPRRGPPGPPPPPRD